MQTNLSKFIILPCAIYFSSFCLSAKAQNSYEPKYSDYKIAKKYAKSKDKILLLYFTSKFSVNSRLLEQKVLDDTEVIKLLGNSFIIATLYIDKNMPNGIANSALQEKFGTHTQPTIYFINPKDKILDSIVGFTTKEIFITTIKKIKSTVSQKQ